MSFRLFSSFSAIFLWHFCTRCAILIIAYHCGGIFLKRFCVFFCVLAALTLCFPAAAALVTYEVPELYMELDFPDSWYVLTRHTEADDPGLYFYDDDPEHLFASLEAQDMYLDAIDLDGMMELVIIMTPNEDIFDLSLWDEAFVDEAAEYFANNPVWAGDNAVQCFRETDYYQSGARFITYNRTETQGDLTLRCFQMSTVYNGQSIHLILTDYSDSITFESGALARSMSDIVSTLSFTEDLTPPDEVYQAAGLAPQRPQSGPGSSGLPADAVEVIASLVPLLIMLALVVIGKRAKTRRAAVPARPAAPSAQPVRPQPPRPQTSSPRPSSAVSSSSRPAAAARPRTAPPAAESGRPVQPAPDRRPKHNCSGSSTETVFCLDCGKKVSLSQQRCPHCGARIV